MAPRDVPRPTERRRSLAFLRHVQRCMGLSGTRGEGPCPRHHVLRSEKPPVLPQPAQLLPCVSTWVMVPSATVPQSAAVPVREAGDSKPGPISPCAPCSNASCSPSGGPPGCGGGSCPPPQKALECVGTDAGELSWVPGESPRGLIFRREAHGADCHLPAPLVHWLKHFCGAERPLSCCWATGVLVCRAKAGQMLGPNQPPVSRWM